MYRQSTLPPHTQVGQSAESSFDVSSPGKEDEAELKAICAEQGQDAPLLVAGHWHRLQGQSHEHICPSMSALLHRSAFSRQPTKPALSPVNHMPESII